MNNVIEKPYLSIVITSRNDDHGGNMLHRMQVSLNGLLEQLEKHHIESELILVEWNPPDDSPLLKDMLKWPEKLRYCTVRATVVPPKVHQRYEYSDKLPMNGIVALNYGIRRARGQFILPSNMDLLYSDELMAYIASKSLKGDERYRVERHDVDRHVVQYDTLKEQLDYCPNNVIRVHAHLHSGAKEGLPDLHVNASGDFQLMSRQNWHLLRGYREGDIIGAYDDSLMSYASYMAGVKEVVLNEPIRLYHIDHEDKFNDKISSDKLPLENWLSFSFLPAWLNRKIMTLYRMFLNFIGYKFKSSVNGVPTLDISEYRKIRRDMLAARRPYIFNDEDWGLGQESFEEFTIKTADWDKDYDKN